MRARIISLTGFHCHEGVKQASATGRVLMVAMLVVVKLERLWYRFVYEYTVTNIPARARASVLGELQIRNTSRLGGIHFTHIFPLCLAVIVSVAHVDARGCCVNTVRERTARVCVCAHGFIFLLKKKKVS